MEAVPVDPGLVGLAVGLGRLQTALSDAEGPWSTWLAAVDPGQRANARNMVHYWALRQQEPAHPADRSGPVRPVVARTQ